VFLKLFVILKYILFVVRVENLSSSHQTVSLPGPKKGSLLLDSGPAARDATFAPNNDQPSKPREICPEERF